MTISLPWLGADPRSPFPAAEAALRQPDGLLAAGGDLRPERLLNAYRHGIFPWYSQGQPILWWCPDPRWVFHTDAVHLSRRSHRQVRGRGWRLRADRDFDAVVAACAQTPRPRQDGTWITPAMRRAYGELHRLGHAHSIEVLADGRLIGGLYGVAIGRMFFAESMFSGESGGSKAALAGLAALLQRWGWPLIDAQMENAHLVGLGARPLPRREFLDRIAVLCATPEPPGAWRDRVGDIEVRELLAPPGLRPSA